MGLISSLIYGVIHLAFVAMDVLMLMIIVQAVYIRWQLKWLSPIANTIEPLMKIVVGKTSNLATAMTGKSFSRRTLLIFLVIGLSVLRYVIVGLFAS